MRFTKNGFPFVLRENNIGERFSFTSITMKCVSDEIVLLKENSRGLRYISSNVLTLNPVVIFYSAPTIAISRVSRRAHSLSLYAPMNKI
jgi:hypothetical protein